MLNRPKLRAKFPALITHVVSEFLTRLASEARLVEPVPLLIVLERDRKDEKYINLTLAGNATRLVTRDLALLDLNLPQSTLGRALRARAPLLRIVDPVEMLRILEGTPKPTG